MMVILQVVCFALASYSFSADEVVYASELNVSAQVLQEFGTGPLWQGEAEEAPVLMQHEFGLLQSSQQPRYLTVVQACIEQGNSTVRPALLFSVLPAPMDPTHILSAVLQVFVPADQLTTRTDFIMIRVYQVVSGQPLDQPDAHRVLAVQYPPGISPPEGKWLKFNVLAAVTEWLMDVRPNLGLLVTQVEYGLEGSHRPLLIVKYGTKQPSGSLPEVPFEVSGFPHSSLVDEALGPGMCARHPWLLDFSQWGLLEPRALDVGRCSGRCSGLGTAEHTALLDLLANQEQPGACCVPLDYQPAPILYREHNGNFVIRVLHRITVNSCVCK